jgi:hypothetical protein
VSWVLGGCRADVSVGLPGDGRFASRSPASSARHRGTCRALRLRQLGGFLNATFGNAAELIIAVVALDRDTSSS